MNYIRKTLRPAGAHSEAVPVRPGHSAQKISLPPAQRRHKSRKSGLEHRHTYIRLKDGFAYLTAVIDWYGRRILSWRLSTTLSTDFCEECDREGCPARLGMDGRGRACDNIFVERFWRTLKYEDIYLKGYGTVAECRKGLVRSLDGNTPSDIYFGKVWLEKVA